MESDELFEVINEFFDGELNKNREPALFLSLSTNEIARNYFKGHHLLKTVTKEMQDEFPQELERKILSKTISFEKKRFLGQRLKPFLVYASIIIFFLVGLFFYTEANSYKNDLAKINSKLENQDKTIESILNPLPSAEVKGVHQEDMKAIIVKSTKL